MLLEAITQLYFTRISPGQHRTTTMLPVVLWSLRALSLSNHLQLGNHLFREFFVIIAVYLHYYYASISDNPDSQP